MTAIVATVAGEPVWVSEVDASEDRLRAGARSSALPRHGTSEGRQLRRWLTQLLVAEKVVAVEAVTHGVVTECAPSENELLPDVSARLDLGSVAAAVLALPVARALFMVVTAHIEVADSDVAEYHRRNPLRFAALRDAGNGWQTKSSTPAPLGEVSDAIAEQLRAAARRRAFRQWLDLRREALVELAPGFEHPGDPRQPDNTHKH